MFLPDLVVRSHHVVTPRGMRSAAIHVRGQRVVGVLDFADVPDGCPVDDAGSAVVLPGIVDTRVHVDAAGAEAERAFAAITRAAAAGGVTSIVIAPSDRAPATSVASLEAGRRSADGHSWVDVGFWGGISSGNASEMRPLFEAGVLGFECVSDADLKTVMPGIRYLGATLLVRESLLELCREYQTRTHIVQLSSSNTLTPLFHGRAANLALTAETCPHYLNLIEEELAAEAATLHDAPPIGDRENREFLWAALANGLIQTVSADRFTPLELSLPLMWLGARGRNYPIERLAEWMSLGPARLAGLTRKGSIEVGYDADLVIFDPDADAAPHEHQRFYGRRRPRGSVERTYLRGSLIYSRADGWAGEPHGNLMRRVFPLH